MSKAPRKILIRAVNWIGDAVMTLPALEAVKRLYPQASITVLARPWAAEVYRNHPAVDEILIYDNVGRHRGFAGKLRLARELRAKKIDTALLFQNAFDAALIAFLARIPVRVGYNRDARRILLTRAIALREGHKLKDGARLRHHVDYYLDLIEGWSEIDPRMGHETAMRMHPADAERAWAESFITSNGLDGAKIIGINPGATFGSSKRWFPERFAGAADSLAERLGAGVIIFGGPAEVSIAGEIAGRMRNKPVVATGKTTLRELAALVERCDLFITNDSGPMHMAAALDRPVVALFGSTSPEATGPFCRNCRVVRPAGLECAPCFKRKCDKAALPVCMERISVEMVTDAAMELLAKGNTVRANGRSPLPAVFVDRDGTVIEEVNYLSDIRDLRPFDGAGDALQMLRDAGFLVVLITNQSGVARGYFTEDFVRLTHERLQEMIGFRFDGIFYCPHGPDDGCSCRKPEPGMVEQAARELGIDISASYMIGDKPADIELAARAGMKGVLVTTGYGAETAEGTRADITAEGIAQAARLITFDINSGLQPADHHA